MKKLLLILLAVPLLGGCGFAPAPGNDTGTSYITEAHVKLDDGRTVTCLVFHAGYKGGLSCDWGKAK